MYTYTNLISGFDGDYKLNIKSDGDDVVVTYDFDAECGTANLEGKGKTLSEAIDDILLKTEEWCKEEENKDNDEVFLEDLDKEDLIELADSQIDNIAYLESVIEDKDKELEELKAEVKELKDMHDELIARNQRQAESIEDYQINVHQLESKLNKLKDNTIETILNKLGF